jgi:hypothetical protein
LTGHASRTGRLITLCLLTLAAGCGNNPEDLWASNTALVAVDTGPSGSFQELRADRTLISERDNPPIFGWIPFTGTVVSSPSSHDSFLTRSLVWTQTEFRFDGSQGHTFTDTRNPDGMLSVAPIGQRTDQNYIRYHTNGLLLQPGDPVHLALQKHVYLGRPYSGHWEWETFPSGSAAAGSIELDPTTALVPVRVLRIDEPGVTQPWALSEALAQMWFDGRAVDHSQTSLSSGGSLNSFVNDQDPRPTYENGQVEPWGPSAMAGTAGGTEEQQPDAVWCVCSSFHKNIQFRLVDFQEVNAGSFSQACAATASLTDHLFAQTCLRGWTSVADRVHPLPNAVTLAFVHNYAASGDAVAEAFPGDGVVVSDLGLKDATGNVNPENILAHELGHILGGAAPEFLDGFHGPGTIHNLMNDASPVLTAAQCSIAFATAQILAIH